MVVAEDLTTPVRMEAVDRPRRQARAGERAEDLVDVALRIEMAALGEVRASRAFSDADAAACALHLLADTEVLFLALDAGQARRPTSTAAASSTAPLAKQTSIPSSPASRRLRRRPEIPFFSFRSLS